MEPREEVVLRAYEPATIEIDGLAIAIRVKRLSIGEFTEFERLERRAGIVTADRLVCVRRPGEEQERVLLGGVTPPAWQELVAQRRAIADLPADAAGAIGVAAFSDLVTAVEPVDRFVIPDAEIRRRRLQEMDEPTQRRYEAMVAEDAHACQRFLEEALAKFIKVLPGQLRMEDEHGTATKVLDGAQLALCYGARPDVLSAIVFALKLENQLTERQKKTARSLFTLNRSLNGPTTTATGASSASTAVPVAPMASATTAAATPIAASLSGPTDS